MNLKSRSSLLILATLSCLLWGSAFPCLKISASVLELSGKPWTVQVLFAGYRFLGAGLLTLAAAVLWGVSLRIPKGGLRTVVSLGLLQTALQYTLFYVGLSHTTGINGSIITATGTFFAIILSHFHYHNDLLTPRKGLGMIIGFVGVLMAILRPGSTLQLNLMGDGLIMASSLLGAYALILAKDSTARLDPVAVSGYQMTFGGALMLLLGGSASGFDAIRFPGVGLLLLAYLAFLSAAAFGIWYLLLKHHPVSKVSINKFQIPIWGVLLSALLLPNETLSPMVLLSLGAVITGILVVHTEAPATESPHGTP